jgi:2-dehydro-3-deoxyphosphogluconate aldolase/(4S)-4-hydroxy-2-oxoglutarate aldolase
MARFDRLQVLNTLLDDGLVPLFFNGDLETARQIAGALHSGGSRVLEFTNRGDFAVEVFGALVKVCAQHLPGLILGAGSVEDAATAALFLANGANFVVGPNFNPEIARLCNRRKIAYLPGCATVTEIATAEEWGVEIVKIFPGETIGGPEFVRAVRGPRPWTRLMPTGGVSTDEANLRAWLDAGVACVGIGSALIRADWVKAADYAAIQSETQAVLQRIRAIRQPKP